MTIATINPATGEKLAEFAPLTGSEIEAKLNLALDAFRAYRQTPFAVRAGMMNRAAEILESEQ